MFGVSFPELLVLGTVALLVLGPDKLPGMLRTVGNWIARLRRLTTEVRHQSGIDDVLRSEGFDGGLNELRSLMRGGVGASLASQTHSYRLPPVEPFVADKSREYPEEGPDAYGALPEDLVPVPPAVPQLSTANADIASPAPEPVRAVLGSGPVPLEPGPTTPAAEVKP